MTGEECREVLARAREGAEAKWQEIGRVRQNYLELHAHALRAQEELSQLMEEVEQTRLLYEALLGVRPEATWLGATPADAGGAAGGGPADDPGGGRKPGRVARRKRKAKAEGGDSPPPAAAEEEGGAE